MYEPRVIVNNPGSRLKGLRREFFVSNPWHVLMVLSTTACHDAALFPHNSSSPSSSSSQTTRFPKPCVGCSNNVGATLEEFPNRWYITTLAKSCDARPSPRLSSSGAYLPRFDFVRARMRHGTVARALYPASLTEPIGQGVALRCHPDAGRRTGQY